MMEPDIVACFDSIVDALQVIAHCIQDAAQAQVQAIESIEFILEGFVPTTQAKLDLWSD